jgi:hypothetical protein
MATMAQRITDLIGSDYSTIATNTADDILNSAIAEMADLLPNELLIKYAPSPTILNNSPTSWTAVEGKKILQVIRLDASGGKYRECQPLEKHHFDAATDTDSLYLATKHTPVYTLYNNAGTTTLYVSPTTTTDETASIYYFEYPTSDQTGQSTITGLPNEVLHAVALKASIGILQAYISDWVQDEEDQEIQNMLNNQIVTLQNLYTQEIARFTEEQSVPRGE